MMSQTSQVYAHLNEPAEKPEVSRFSEVVSRGNDYVRHQSSQIRMPEFIMVMRYRVLVCPSTSWSL